MTKRIYFDYNATTPLSEEVLAFYTDTLKEYANASSLHEDGRRSAELIKKARSQVASLIHAPDAADILFTSGGSESNNTVFNTMIAAGEKRNNKFIAVSAIEHPCVLESAKKLQNCGFTVEFLPVDCDGIIDDAAYRAALEKKPLLVSIMAANNEIGTIQDIPFLAERAHKAGALFHTDMVQACGKIPVDVAAWDVDYATVSAHKIYGPKGIGALYVKKGAPIEPLIRGGHQEHGLRAGTYNVPAIAAFGYASELALQNLSSYASLTGELRRLLRDGLLERIPDIKINGHAERVLPNTLDVSFPGAEGEAILLHLDLLGFAASTGSACASGSLEPSHVLMATGMGAELAHGSIRFSLGMGSTKEDVQALLDMLPPVIDKLRKMSTLSGAEAVRA
ncbi:cysteine desulfurase family protein [Treponema sp. HNW]|uniref:cysteine desulfurase family protein n=1 Tax=Treponema sp. HNW TaxID=3116654 RepID=UPI003D13D5A9